MITECEGYWIWLLKEDGPDGSDKLTVDLQFFIS